MHRLRKPYLLFLGDAPDKITAKTAFGLRDWCPADILGEWSLPDCVVTLDLERLSPAAAAARGAGFDRRRHRTGGRPSAAALDRRVGGGGRGRTRRGQRPAYPLDSIPELVEAAARGGGRLIDVRHSDKTFSAASGRRRSGKRLLTVGTDCALGKKYTGAGTHPSVAVAGNRGDVFVATGQDGDHDFRGGHRSGMRSSPISSRAPPRNCRRTTHPSTGTSIEGQGSLFHPAYAGVTLGLLHGSQPDAIVLCHDPSRRTIDEYPGFPIPDLQDAIDLYLRVGRLTNPGIRCVGLSINSSSLTEAEYAAYVQSQQSRLGLPVVDPMRGGVEALTKSMLT